MPKNEQFRVTMTAHRKGKAPSVILLTRAILEKDAIPPQKVEHYWIENGKKESVPQAYMLEIGKEKDGEHYVLLHNDENNHYLTHTFHGSLIEAMEQARYEYDVPLTTWTFLCDQDHKNPTRFAEAPRVLCATCNV